VAEDELSSNHHGASRYAIDSALKTLQVLFAFAEPPHALTMVEIEQVVGLSKNQVFRCLKSMEEFGLVRLDQEGKYRVTPLIRRLASAAENEPPLEEIALPVMIQLQQMTAETVNLCCLVEKHSVIVARRHSRHGVRLNVRLGERTGLHAGASPKAMLAFLSAETQEEVISMLPSLHRYTDRTAQDRDLFRRELEETRARGYSISDEDFEPGARGVGAPIFGRDGNVVGGISAGGPISRVGPGQVELFGQLTVLAARRVSRMLGSGGNGNLQGTSPVKKEAELVT
jgi:DNA-binding IclR family transcriptional regulator